MSANCRGLGSQQKRRDVMSYIKQLGHHIVFLQETHLTPASAARLNLLWPGRCYHACKNYNSRGTSILMRSNVNHEVIAEEYCPEGNFVILVCKINGNVYTLINIYGPNRDCPEFFADIDRRIDGLPQENIIIGGDFNFVIDFKVDSNYLSQNNPRARNAYVELAEKYSLVDIWRLSNPTKHAYTWKKNNPLRYGRLDMLFVSDNLIDNVSSVEITAGYRTDHDAVSLTLQNKQLKRGPGLWKFNSSLLADESYCIQVKQTVLQVVEQYAIPVYSSAFLKETCNFKSIDFTISIGLFYETLLMMIRGETVRFSKRKARRHREEETSLVVEINHLKSKADEEKSQYAVEKLDEAKKKLEQLRAPAIQGMIIRSRVAWYEDGEKSSKYFLSLEKRNGARSTPQTLECDGQLIADKTKILEKFSENLRQKYQKIPVDHNISSYLDQTINNRLSTDQREILEHAITPAELQSAIFSMKKGKSPGSNGFTSEFFRHFWELVGPFLHRAFIEEMKNGEMLTSHRESIVTYIPKIGRPRSAVNGWRPISLLNVDFKIISAALTNRLKSVMNVVISPSQSAYIQGRSIEENSRLVYDVIEHLKINGKSGSIIAADFESAFESISWSFLSQALERYNFGPNFRRMIEVIYLSQNNFARVIMDGFLGEKVFMERGIRQGDPASGYLFNLAIEPLASQLLQSRSFRGIQVSPTIEVRLSQYADDLIIFTDSTLASTDGALKECAKFSETSGLMLNVEKTKCLEIGVLSEVACPRHVSTGVQVVKELKILGITFNATNEDITALNIDKVLNAIRSQISQWKRRQLTLIGKITIIRSLLLPKLTHLFLALPDPPQVIIKRLNCVLHSFLWNSKAEKVKRSKIIQKYKDDGLDMIDIVAYIKSMKASWLQRLSRGKGLWVQIAKTIIPRLDELVCYGSFKLKTVKDAISNPFWKDVIGSWAEFCYNYRPDEDELATEKLWFSDIAKFKRSIIKSWDRRGIRFLADILDPENGGIYDRAQLQNKFNVKMTFLCYSSLCRSLPDVVRDNSFKPRIIAPIYPYKLALVSRSTKLSKIVYSTSIAALHLRQGKTENKTEKKWHRDIGETSVGTMRVIRSVTKNTYIQSFHFRVISRIIATNRFLSIVGIVDDPSCGFCQSDDESIVHLFWSCTFVQSFIEDMKAYFLQTFNITFTVTKNIWFFPTLEMLSPLEVLIISLAKVVIYSAKRRGSFPTLQHLLSTLRLEAQKEHGSAINQGKQAAFNEKWGRVGRDALTGETET